MQKSNVVLALTPREADFLEDLLDDQSYRMGCARKPGAGPSRKEKLLNSITEKLIYAAANARPRAIANFKLPQIPTFSYSSSEVSR